MRKITIVSTNTDQVFDVESSAETWGELKRESSISNVSSGMKAMIRETKNTLESDQAILPQGDFVLYLTPSKVKSGWSSDDLSDFEELIEMAENEDKIHLVRFLNRLKNGSTSGSSDSSEGFPVLVGLDNSSEKSSVNNTRNAELLAEARRIS